MLEIKCPPKRVITGIPHMTEEVARWWDEIEVSMLRKNQGGQIRKGEGIQTVLTRLDVSTKFQSWDIKIATGLMKQIPEDSSFKLELASEYRKTMEASGIHRGRPLMARIMYRYEDSDTGTCVDAWTRLMELQLKVIRKKPL